MRRKNEVDAKAFSDEEEKTPPMPNLLMLGVVCWCLLGFLLEVLDVRAFLQQRMGKSEPWYLHQVKRAGGWAAGSRGWSGTVQVARLPPWPVISVIGVRFSIHCQWNQSQWV